MNTSFQIPSWSIITVLAYIILLRVAISWNTIFCMTPNFIYLVFAIIYKYFLWYGFFGVKELAIGMIGSKWVSEGNPSFLPKSHTRCTQASDSDPESERGRRKSLSTSETFPCRWGIRYSDTTCGGRRDYPGRLFGAWRIIIWAAAFDCWLVLKRGRWACATITTSYGLKLYSQVDRFDFTQHICCKLD